MNQLHHIHQPLVMLGAGGHAKVLLSLIHACELSVAGICDPQLSKNGAAFWNGVPVLGGDDALDKLDTAVYGLVNGVGQLPRQDMRQRLYERYRAKGFVFPFLVHPFSWVSEDVVLDDGVQIMAGAVLQPGSQVGNNSIINTRVSVDHDCRIGEHVHIAPGATLCGSVNIAPGSFIGAGATIIHGVSVGSRAIVGAGVTCIRSLDSGEVLANTLKSQPTDNSKR